MIRLALFDIDGTLILSGGAGEKAFGQVFAEVFGVPDANRGVRFAGRTDTAIVGEVLERHGIPASPANFARFFAEYPPRLQAMLHQLQGGPLPGVRELVDGLARLPGGPLLGLLTGNIRRGAELKLGHYQLWEPFRLGAFADGRTLRNDVAAFALEEGRRMLGSDLHPDEILVIGDTPADIECGRHIGAQVLAVATGQFPPADLEAHRPDVVLRTLAETSPAAVQAGWRH